jgi:hypothetical protein
VKPRDADEEHASADRLFAKEVPLALALRFRGKPTALIVLLYFIALDGMGGPIFPKVRTIATKLGFHPKRVSEAIAVLSEAGALRVEKRYRRPSIYTLVKGPEDGTSPEVKGPEVGPVKGPPLGPVKGPSYVSDTKTNSETELLKVDDAREEESDSEKRATIISTLIGWGVARSVVDKALAERHDVAARWAAVSPTDFPKVAKWAAYVTTALQTGGMPSPAKVRPIRAAVNPIAPLEERAQPDSWAFESVVGGR